MSRKYIFFFLKKKCLLKHFIVRLEIYFRDSRSLLVVFLDKKRRSDFEQHLPNIMGRPASELVMSPVAGSQPQRTPLLGRMGSRVFSGFRVDELSTATRKWQARELSNVCLVIAGLALCSLSRHFLVCLFEHIESNIWEDS